MIYSVTNIYYQQCRDKGIDLKFNIGKIEYESLVGDSYRIRQVLLNFLSNSVKFTERGGTIEVFLDEEVRRDSIILTFSVSDNGCGMDEDLQKRLFHKFEQQNATTVSKYGGSGLGLSICHKLVELMEGEISVESQKGIGTAFTVQIPLKKGSSPIDIALNDIKGLKVLIVDEDEITCKYLSSVFFKWHINNDYCTSSNSAIEKVKNNRSYSLYIIDMKMPKINGVELITELRNITKVDSTIIIMSGYDIDEKILISKNIDLKRFVRKPVFSTELYYTIIGDWGRDAIEQDSDNIRLENINVLLVEDNKMNQLIASRIIEKKGAVVDTCNNGQEAVKIIQEKKVLYDVVLMDIQMPIMNGYEATRIIRSIDDEYAKNILIYAMTANSFNSDVQKASDIGMNGHISKPIDTKTLFKILDKIKQKK